VDEDLEDRSRNHVMGRHWSRRQQTLEKATATEIVVSHTTLGIADVTVVGRWQCVVRAELVQASWLCSTSYRHLYSSYQCHWYPLRDERCERSMVAG